MRNAFLFARGVRQGLLLMAMIMLALGIAACATTDDTAQGTQTQEQTTEQVAATYGNACEAPARQGCNSCQTSCPSDHIAYCAPGHGYQVLITGGIYEYRCTVGPTCTCKKP